MDLKHKEIQLTRLSIENISLAEQLFQLFKEVFNAADRPLPKKAHLQTLIQNSGFIAFAALHNNEVAGGITAYVLPMYHSERPEMYIYDIAVKPEFQRMGFGKKLLSAVKEYCQENNIREMFVDASEEDKHALDFYRSVEGAREEKVIQFTYTL